MKKEELILLHKLLTNLEVYLAREGRGLNWKSDEMDSIHQVQELIEGAVNRLPRPEE